MLAGGSRVDTPPRGPLMHGGGAMWVLACGGAAPRAAAHAGLFGGGAMWVLTCGRAAPRAAAKRGNGPPCGGPCWLRAPSIRSLSRGCGTRLAAPAADGACVRTQFPLYAAAAFLGTALNRELRTDLCAPHGDLPASPAARPGHGQRAEIGDVKLAVTREFTPARTERGSGNGRPNEGRGAVSQAGKSGLGDQTSGR